MGEDSNCRQVVAGERKAAHLVVAEEHTADQVCRVEGSAGQEGACKVDPERTAEGSAGQEGACTAGPVVVAEERKIDRAVTEERTAEDSAEEEEYKVDRAEEAACKTDRAVEEERTTEDLVVEEEHTAGPECTAEGSAEEAAYKVDLAEQAEQAEQVDLAGAHRADYRQDRQEQGYTERTWAEGSSTSEQGSTEEGARVHTTTPLIQSWAGKAEPCRGTSGRWDPRRRKKRTDRT